MNRIARVPVLAAGLALMMASMTGCQKLQARDQLNKGVEAYKSQKYEEATDHFQKAVQLDPSLEAAKVYLGTAMSQNVVPGLDTPDNVKTANDTIAVFQQVLDKHPDDANSLKQVAAIYFDIKKFDDAKIWQKKVLAVDTKDAEAAYTIGVIDWTQAHENAVKALQPVGINDDGKGNVKMPANVCADIKAKNSALVDEGIKYLEQASDNRPNYDDAMTYLNLIYRRKADVDCGNASAVAADVASADSWRDKAMGARKANEEAKDKSTPGGITMDSNGNMK